MSEQSTEGNYRSIVEAGEMQMLDADELKHGEHQCHECYRVFAVQWPEDVFQTAKTRYCPRCGARL